MDTRLRGYDELQGFGPLFRLGNRSELLDLKNICQKIMILIFANSDLPAWFRDLRLDTHSIISLK
jgi:hypothetical protein